MRYTGYLSRLAPPALQGSHGEQVLRALGAALDAEVRRTQQAVLARHLIRAPTDALELIGQDRRIQRQPNEAEIAWRQRLLAAWLTHSLGGTVTGMIEALKAAGYDATVFEHWRDIPGAWSQFSVSVASPVASLTSWRWDSAIKWDADDVWDVQLHESEPGRLRAIINAVKPARSRLRELNYLTAGGFIWDDPTAVWDATGVDWDAIIPL